MKFAFGRVLIVAMTAAGIWGILAFGQEDGTIDVTVGQPSPERFVASEDVTGIVDVEATEAARAAAAGGVDPVYTTNEQINQSVIESVITFFEVVRSNAVERNPELAVAIEDPFVEAEEPSAPTTTEAPAEGADETTTTTTTVPPNTVGVVGFLFLDLDADGVYSTDAGDLPLSDVDVSFADRDGMLTRARSDAAGELTIQEIQVEGPLLVTVDVDDPDFPDDFKLTTGTNPQVVEDTRPDVVTLEPVGFAPAVVPAEVEEGLLAEEATFVYESTIPTLVELASGDVVRRALGLAPQLADLEAKAVERANQVLREGIDAEDLVAARQLVLDVPPFIVLDGQVNDAAQDAAADIIAAHLVPNRQLDTTATEAARLRAMDLVPDVLVDYKAGQTIVDEGQVVDAVQLQAIESLHLLRPTAVQYTALLAMVLVLVLVVVFYIARFRPGFWHSTRRVVLFGLLLVLAAATIRLSTEVEGLVEGLEGLGGYAIPAAAFGFAVAILFDARIAVLMAMTTSAIAGLATADPGFAIYTLLSAIVPVPFVSAISTRAEFRRAVVYAAVAAAVIAGAVAWFFHAPALDATTTETVGRALGLAFVVSLIATLAGGMALSFFEVLFDITTTLRILDVTDRNHPALQLLQEEAWGSFNHSLMVGTLADAAARAIGANNLLALAAAYYHDLGKTQNPTFFIENQFGISNPHDLLPPEESAAIIRAHVVDGIELARRYRIPSEVADGIRCHHGDGIMRYFYEKAKEIHGAENVDVADYRHAGHKPRTREMAILMMADALEGATRAVFAEEDPSPSRIAQVVERVVGEKVNDGQLSESDLTLGDLTRVKRAFVEALVGHYHQRIPYPNFPELPGVEEPAATALPPAGPGYADVGPSIQSPAEPDVVSSRRHEER